MEWRDINQKTFRTHQSKLAPLWYLNIKDIITFNNSNLLKPEYVRYKHWKFKGDLLNHLTKEKEIATFYHQALDIVVLGTIKKINYRTNTCDIYHY